MTIIIETAPSTDTDVSWLEGIDLSPDQACEDPEHQEHAHRAQLRVRADLPCGCGWTRWICVTSWGEYGHRGLHCHRGCYSATPIHRDEVMRILERRK